MIAALPDIRMVDPGTALAGLAVLLAMAGVAWRDCLTFEIDFALLGVAALSMAALIAGTGPGAGQEVIAGLVVAGLLGSVATLVHLVRPRWFGQGDIWLMGFLGLAAGPDHVVPVLALFALLAALTSACYSRARGKRLFRSLIPAALPGMGAASLAQGSGKEDAMTAAAISDRRASRRSPHMPWSIRKLNSLPQRMVAEEMRGRTSDREEDC